MLNQIKALVFELLDKDNSGHGIDHINRVYDLAIKFAKLENANKTIVAIAALLHDVDDYKLVGNKLASNLTNAKKIMKMVGVDEQIQIVVVDIIQNMGYSKSLKGIRPTTHEGQIVSDADMCDAIGANGIIRSIVYAVSDKGNGLIFDQNIFPNVNISYQEYNAKGTTHSTDNAINHFFEKLLKLPDLMLTNSGRVEAGKRQTIMIEFLYHYFDETNLSNWKQYLDNYLTNLR